MRARGALLGLVVGNQLGVPTEPLGTATAIREAFPQGVRDLAAPPKGSPFDDDAAMTLLLAESLAEKGDFDAHDVAERWVKWMKRDGRGIGLTTQRALRLIERGTEPFEAGRLALNARATSSTAWKAPFGAGCTARPSKTRSSFSPRRVATPTPTPPSRARCSGRGKAKRPSRPAGSNSSATRGECRLWPNDSYKPQALSHKAYDLRLLAVFAYRAIRSITSLSMRVMDTQRAVPRPRQLHRTARLP